MKTSLVPLATSLFLVISGCSNKAAQDSDSEPAAKPLVQVALAKVKRQTMTSDLAVTGTLSPLSDRESKVAPLAPGRILKMYVRTGQRVQKGQALAQLDPGPLQGQVQQALAAVNAAASTLAQAKLNYSLQLRTQSASVIQAQQNVQAQQVALSKLLAGSRPQEIAQAQSAVTTALAALTTAQENLSRSQTLFSQGLLAKKDLESARSQETTAHAQLQSAQEALSLAKEGNRPQDIQAGRVALQQAQEQLRAAKAASLQNDVKAEDVQIAAKQLDASRGALAAARAQLSSETIRAPIAGVVVGRPLNEGEWVDTSSAIATIADMRFMRLILTVPAAQAGLLRVGQTVTFTTETDPHRRRQATVFLIGKATDPTTNTVQAEARTANPDLSLPDDAFVHGDILLAVHPGVLVVPSSAVVDKDAKQTVFLVGKDDIAHAKEVAVGLEEGGVTEIKGLSPGDQVATIGAYELEDGTKVRTSE